MKKFVIGCAVAGLFALSPKSHGQSPQSKSSDPAKAPALAKPTLADSKPKEEHQTGVASWYGEECEGKTTASGEVYDSKGLTAAHLTLPLGTTVRVTNLNNQSNILLRITDRGPYIGRRLIDVSLAAAKRLGFVLSGTTPVRVDVVSYPKTPHSLSTATP